MVDELKTTDEVIIKILDDKTLVDLDKNHGVPGGFGVHGAAPALASNFVTTTRCSAYRHRTTHG
jgi:hypothetical protein